MKWQQLILWQNTFIFLLNGSIMSHGSCWTKVHQHDVSVLQISENAQLSLVNFIQQFVPSCCSLVCDFSFIYKIMKWQQLILRQNTFIFPLNGTIASWVTVHVGRKSMMELYARLGLQPAKTPSTVLAKRWSPSGLPFLKFRWTCFAMKPLMAKILPQIGPSLVRFCVHLVLSVLTVKLLVLEGAQWEINK